MSHYWQSQRGSMRDAYKAFALQFAATDMVTLAINQTRSIEQVRHLIGQFAARMDDWAIGSQWRKSYYQNRANGVFFIEHVQSNIHAHGLVHFPYSTTAERTKIAETFWTQLCASGTMQIVPPYDALGAAGYITKEMTWRNHKADQIILLTDFMSDTSLTRKPLKPR